MAEAALDGVPAVNDDIPGEAVDNAPPMHDPGPESKPSIDKFQTWEDLEKGYRELEAYRGTSVRIPTPEAGEQDWAEFNEKIMQVPGVVRLPGEGEDPGAFYARLGKPDAPDKYEFEAPEGYQPDPADQQALAQFAFDNNLTREQANSLHSYLATNIAETEKAQMEAGVQELKGLQDKWGKAYDHNFALAQNAARALNDQIPGIYDQVKELDPSQPYNTMAIQMLKVLGDMMGEKGVVDAQRPDGIMSPDEAMLKAQDIRNNPDHPYNNELDPAHMSAQKQMADLYKIAYGR